MHQRHTLTASALKVFRLGGVTGVILLMMALVALPRQALADSTDIQFDTTANTSSATPVHSLSGSFTVGNNLNRYFVVGISLSADTTSDVLPVVSKVAWTVGSTTQTFGFKQGQNSTTGSDDTARAEIWELVAPTAGTGTLSVTLDTKAITNETADSSPTGSTSVSNESLATGDGSTTTFSGNLANTPIVRQTLTITAGSVTATDDGSGNLSGTGVTSGSINYDTGAWSITYDTAPANGTAITAGYDYGKWKFSGTLQNTPVDPCTVTFSATVGGATKTASDNGSGSITGDSGNITGTIDYSTGAWTLEYQTPPDSGTNITADYERQNQAEIVAGALSLYNVNQATPSPTGTASGGESTTPYVNIDSDTRHAVFAVITTTGPAGTATARSNITERWNHTNGTGNTDTIGAGGTAPGVESPSSTLMAWDLTNSRKWAAAGIDIQPPSTPTLARFARARAFSTDHGTLVQWRTAYEVRNLGFQVYREDASGNRVLLNRSLIAGSALFAGPSTVLSAGRSYTFWDPGTRNFAPSVYWLRAIDLDGSATWYGPFLAEPADGHIPLGGPGKALRQDRTMVFSPSLTALGRAASTTKGMHRVQRTAGRVSHRVLAASHQWCIAAAPGIKLLVDHEGLYRVTRAQLAQVGFDPGPDPVDLELVCDGHEHAMRLTGMADGTFDMNDAIEFYGVGVDTPYTGRNVYWLTDGPAPGARIEAIPGASTNLKPVTTFPAVVERRDRTTYVAAVTNNGNRGNFYGAVVAGDPVHQTLDVDALPGENVTSTHTSQLELVLQGITKGDHEVSVSFNGHPLDSMSFNGFGHPIKKYEIPESWLVAGTNTVTLQSTGGDTDVSMVDWIRLAWDRPCVARNDALSMTAPGGAQVHISGFSKPGIHLFDVTNPRDPVEIKGTVTREGSGWSIEADVDGETGGAPRSLYAVASTGVATPAAIELNTPTSWNRAQNHADMVIITNPILRNAADRLAAYRTQHGLETVVVDVTDIYDEFNFGVKDPAAIRAFLTRAEKAWSIPPKYVLLMGDASIDPRNYLGFGDRDLVPTKMVATNFLKTADDDWFADINGDGFADLAIGRLPADSLDDAETMVGKIIGYEQNDQTWPWSERLTLVADATSPSYTFSKITTALDGLIPAGIQKDTISIGQAGRAAAKRQIIDAFNAGRLVINYDGHGSEAVWSSSNVFDDDDARALTNAERLPLVVAMNCLNGLFEDVYQSSLAEALLQAPKGGAVAVWASSALTDPTGQDLMNRAFFKKLFDGSHPAIGDAVRAAKKGITDQDIRNTWILFGDPSMHLK